MVIEQRVHPREDIALRLQLNDGSSATILNISASGLYVEIPGTHQLEGSADFQMEVAGLRFTSQVEVLRLDYQIGRTGVAFKFLSPKLQAIR